jgi:hypothetical protein
MKTYNNKAQFKSIDEELEFYRKNTIIRDIICIDYEKYSEEELLTMDSNDLKLELEILRSEIFAKVRKVKITNYLK